MPNKSRVKNQNLIDFVIQNYGETDKVIDFIALNDLEYDEFLDQDRYTVEGADNRVKDYIVDSREDVVSGLDTSGYTDLYAEVTYYTPNSGTPTSILVPDPNIIADDDTTAEFDKWEVLDERFGTGTAVDDSYIYTVGNEWSGVSITVGVFYKPTMLKDLIVADYRVTFDLTASDSFTGYSYLGGSLASGGANWENIYYSTSSGTTEITQYLNLVDGNQRWIKNWFNIVATSIPSGSTITIENFDIYKV